jgi:hypothetical protein
MMGHLIGSPKETAVFWRFAPTIALALGLAPAIAHAQTNIDQGKSPGEIFANVCASCHKGARGLAKGRGSSELASFLVEHYTASRDQASAMAAYVMGAGGGEPAQARTAPKPAAAGKPDEPPKTAAHPGTPGKPATKPEEPGQSTAKLKPEEEKKPLSGPPLPGTPRNRPGAPQPAAASAEPPASGTPVQESAPSPAAPAQNVTAPANPESGETTLVPRDDIPD